MNVKVTAFNKPRLTVVPGYDVIPESRVFSVQPTAAAGTVTVRGRDGELHELRLLSINSWTDEQRRALFNREFARLIHQALKDHLIDDFVIVGLRIEGITFLHVREEQKAHA